MGVYENIIHMHLYYNGNYERGYFMRVSEVEPLKLKNKEIIETFSHAAFSGSERIGKVIRLAATVLADYFAVQEEIIDKSGLPLFSLFQTDTKEKSDKVTISINNMKNM